MAALWLEDGKSIEPKPIKTEAAVQELYFDDAWHPVIVRIPNSLEGI